MADTPSAAVDTVGRTAWGRGAAAPLRAFLVTESGSAGVLVTAIAAALIWANIDYGSYEHLWQTHLSIRLGSNEVARDLRFWVNSGLMTFFFLVVGLEARREFDLGDLRDRRNFVLPCLAGLFGSLIPVLIYLAVNHGGPGTHGWGIAMSTDTALALGALALLGRSVPDKVGTFLLTVFIVDDVVALIVIALAYSDNVEMLPLAIAIATFVLLLVVKRLPIPFSRVLIYSVLGLVIWSALLTSGVDPVVAGLAIGLSASAYTPARRDLEEATGLVRLFREQPTPELAREATLGLTATLSPNERLQHFYHPWTSYVIVPLFGLANAGIVLKLSFLRHAYTEPITIGVMLAYLLGKPLAVVGTSWTVTRATRGRMRPAVGWVAVLGSGTIAGVGFTVSFLIATLAFHGPQLADAKLGVMTAALGATLLTWIVFRVVRLMAPMRRAVALFGEPDQLVDLASPVDDDRDHIRGPADAPVTLVEYGDFECPYCGLAEPVVRELLTETDVRYIWRHLPLTDVHPNAQLAAEASEAAAEQGAFWPMHDLLLAHQAELKLIHLLGYADSLGLDRERFTANLKGHMEASRVAQDIESADLSGVSGTPTFFINGQRQYGTYDVPTLSAAVKAARTRVAIAQRSQ
jgi:Na+/H+ antiporter NhaA